MRAEALKERLECFPVIAAIRDDKWRKALSSPCDVLFYLQADLMTVKERIRQAHEADKILFVHLDLADGIGKDRSGIDYLAKCGVDGIISTKAHIIRLAKEAGLLTVQRFFALDSQGMDSVQEMLKSTSPHFMEIMPGVIPKVVRRFSGGSIPVIAGGLIDTRQEVTAALGSGATAISTGAAFLWED
jgi:glycerol uptake operon antiterminator